MDAPVRRGGGPFQLWQKTGGGDLVKKHTNIIAVICLLTGSLWAQLDQYGGYTGLHTKPTGFFTTAQFGSRLMLVDPLGNAYYAKGADLTTDIGTTPGNQIPYIGIYAYDSASSTFSANLATPAAEDITPNDVVNVAGVTAHNVNDALYIGFARPFSMTYFNVNTLGVGGKIQWYYSASGGAWHPINGTGNPKTASALNGDHSYNLDIGNYLVPNANGFYTAAGPTGNLVQWWTASGFGASYLFFPANLVKTVVNGSASLYYIKGVVTQAFTTSPKAGQIVDLTNAYNANQMKYGVNGSSTSQIQRWYNRTMLRMQAWGLNLAPYDSNRLWLMGPANPTNRMPEIVTWQLSGDSMEGRYFGFTSSTATKNIYQGTGCSIYPGKHPDVFDPAYTTNMNARAAVNKTHFIIDAWTIAIDPEEADWIFGFGSYFKHAHIGAVVVFGNPQHPTGTDPLGKPITYAYPNLYSKYAVADMLRYEYKGAGDPIPAFTISSDVMGYYNTYIVSGGSAATTALANLNAAWSMSYTRWTSNGGWGTGTGFMDEAGTSVTNLVSHITHGCSGLFPISFHSTPAAIATDLTAFEVLATAKYGTVMHAAVHAQAPNTMIALFIYQPPTEVAAGIGPYIDFAEISPGPVPAQYGGNTIYQEGVRIYNALQKPVIYHDYHSSNPDSPMTFGGTITGLTYSGGQTQITWTGVPYEMRFSWTPEFPGSTSAPCTAPRTAVKANWKTIWVTGDYTHCTSVGQPVRMSAADYWVGNFNQSDTQGLKAAAIVNEYTNYNALQGSDGKYFNAGVSHWAWNDDSAMSGSEWYDFGFVTAWDNAYDGIEAMHAVSRDSSGYVVGGEARDCGNFIGPLSAYLVGLNNYSNLPGLGGGPQYYRVLGDTFALSELPNYDISQPKIVLVH